MWSTQKKEGGGGIKVFNVLRIVLCHLVFTECTAMIGISSLIDMGKVNNSVLMSCCQTSCRKLYLQAVNLLLLCSYRLKLSAVLLHRHSSVLYVTFDS